MCGIAGYAGRHDPGLLAAMSCRIAHRGPDGAGQWSDAEARIGLAHRRLSIIDTSIAAAQPMLSCNGRYVVVFNGEIYNFRELAAELIGRGYDLNTHSDTAVLAPLYDLHGEAMLSRLNGMFAFAVYDRTRRELLVARDAFGVKPLYYHRSGAVLLFASELRALLADSGLDRSLDAGAIADYLTHLWSPGERTPLRAVAKLPPGHLIRVRAGGIEIERWHQPPRLAARGETVGDAKALAAGLGPLFDRVVADQCISDVPIGAFLSGGLDSSAVVAAMSAGGHTPRRTYCIGFDGVSLVDEGFVDDLTYAREVAACLGVALTPVMVGAPTMSELAALVTTLEEPEADPAPLYVGAISAAARADGIKVLLSGTGGDDIFTGYRRHRAAAMRARLGAGAGAGRALAALPNAALQPFGRPLRRRIEKLGYMLAGTDEEFLIRAFEYNPRGVALACLDADMRSAATSPPSTWLADAIARTKDWPLVERMLELELNGFLPDHNLNYTDKASMAHGVEVRVPFLDERLLGFARRIPWQSKVGWFAEKWALKQGVGARLPRSVLTRAKTGFGAPVRLWLKGRMGVEIRDLIGSRLTRERGVIDGAAVDLLLADTLAGRRDGTYLVLALVMTELWMRAFVDRDGATAAGGIPADRAAG